MTSLGALLQAQLDADERCGLLELERQAKLAGPMAMREVQLVEEFFTNARRAFREAILADAGIPLIQLGNGQNGKVFSIVDAYDWTYVSSIRTKGHRYYPVWARFEHWCHVNGLEPVLSDRFQDGVETWWVLTVQPAKEPESDAIQPA